MTQVRFLCGAMLGKYTAFNVYNVLKKDSSINFLLIIVESLAFLARVSPNTHSEADLIERFCRLITRHKCGKDVGMYFPSSLKEAKTNAEGRAMRPFLSVNSLFEMVEVEMLSPSIPTGMDEMFLQLELCMSFAAMHRADEDWSSWWKTMKESKKLLRAIQGSFPEVAEEAVSMVRDEMNARF